MLLSKLLDGCAVLCAPSYDPDIVRVVTDSAKAGPNDLFVALRGERYDGNDFAAEALRRGAAAVLTDRMNVSGEKYVAVKDAYSAAARVFSNYYGDPTKDLTVAAITGTNGKTSCAAALSHILRQNGVKTGSIGTTGITVGSAEEEVRLFAGEESTMTTPDVATVYKAAYLAKRSGCGALVLEASSHALSRRRLDAFRIDAGVFTNLSRDHLDYHGDMETYFNEKRRLVSLCGEFLSNADDPYGARLIKEDGALAYGTERGSIPLFAEAKNISFSSLGVSYDLIMSDASVRISSPVFGTFGVYNTLAAASAALLLGVDARDAAKALATFEGVPGRMEEIRRGDYIALIDYAHTPDALKKALINVKRHYGRRVILVFGCGGDRDRSKRAPMGRAASRYAYHTVITEDNSRSEDVLDIIDDITEGIAKGASCEVIPDRERAIRRAVSLAGREDVVLCCGKGHEKYIIDKNGKRPFDERQIIESALGDKE
ncbi:MAG: UDP-N-acetylmuramoyl-L-alanyl-D-glutamate--2,6-diaminopimelate ligase [Clostridia bacterium]|nr:UDP-N-acetylmuramoyl-L-alanyl-D-glutamate--2,6-diaminopimelate ligase [Clostridia bacterium]